MSHRRSTRPRNVRVYSGGGADLFAPVDIAKVLSDDTAADTAWINNQVAVMFLLYAFQFYISTQLPVAVLGQ
jgi:hypothetical protein